jgi:hypothetical protein
MARPSSRPPGVHRVRWHSCTGPSKHPCCLGRAPTFVVVDVVFPGKGVVGRAFPCRVGALLQDAALVVLAIAPARVHPRALLQRVLHLWAGRHRTGSKGAGVGTLPPSQVAPRSSTEQQLAPCGQLRSRLATALAVAHICSSGPVWRVVPTWPCAWRSGSQGYAIRWPFSCECSIHRHWWAQALALAGALHVRAAE